MPNFLHRNRALALRLGTALGIAAALGWAGWVTSKVSQDEPPRIVTVRLAETIGGFVDEAARADASPEAVQAASRAYLEAAEAAVAAMDDNQRIVLVAEAVLAGKVEDATPELERRISAQLQQGDRP
jgi:conjugal transfer pilin signal peptidase TrbI